jgi:hypothetical protein
MILTKNSVYRHLIRPLEKRGYIIDLVGSISGIFEKSYNDIDILLHLPEYPDTGKTFEKFEQDLKIMGWEWDFSDEKEGFGIFHNYKKRGIGLDVWIDEVIK